jgi:sugar transferase (PEP-CTERM/EpsH1 system associated)
MPGDRNMQGQTVLHLVYRFDVGGLENVIVNLLNSLPDNDFKHVIISLTDANQNLINKLHKEVEVIQLHKPVGNSLRVHSQLYCLFRRFKPYLVHSYNLATLEYQVIAALAGVKYRIHAEHGRDIYDLDGSNKKYQLLRKLVNPFVHQWIPVSQELASWLVNTVKIPKNKVKRIYNGIDTQKFHPEHTHTDTLFKIITVGRLAPVKDQLTLIKAIQLLVNREPERRKNLHLNIVGDGELESHLTAHIVDNQLQDCVSLSGGSNNVDQLLREADLFVLPSLAEGIALTVLEAMASGLPVIATNVGGNPELITPGANGQLVNSGNAVEIADTICKYMDNRDLGPTQGKAARHKVETHFSLNAMTLNYLNLYHRKQQHNL